VADTTKSTIHTLDSKELALKIAARNFTSKHNVAASDREVDMSWELLKQAGREYGEAWFQYVAPDGKDRQ
jgi:hypothetical protein